MAVLQIPITKGGKTAFVTVDTDDAAQLPDQMLKECLFQGLKSMLNRGMSKITKETSPDTAEREAAALAKAQENVAQMAEGKLKVTGGKAKSGVSGVIKTEARRLARNLIKDSIKAEGGKVSHYEASEITRLANELLEDAEQGPKLFEMAKANLEESTKVPVAKSIMSSIKISDKRVAAAEKRKTEKKGQLSAKQAGLTKKSKPQQATAH